MLVELSDTDDAWSRDLRAASMRCLALLSTADALKPRLADAGALPLLCTAGKPLYPGLMCPDPQHPMEGPMLVSKLPLFLQANSILDVILIPWCSHRAIDDTNAKQAHSAEWKLAGRTS